MPLYMNSSSAKVALELANITQVKDRLDKHGIAPDAEVQTWRGDRRPLYLVSTINRVVELEAARKAAAEKQ